METLIDATGTLPEFLDACRNAFGGTAGTQVLATLCAVAHPLFPPEGRDSHAVAREIGRREIVALLLRSSGNINPTPYARTHNPPTRPADQPIQPTAATSQEDAGANLADALRAAGDARQAILVRVAADEAPDDAGGH